MTRRVARTYVTRVYATHVVTRVYVTYACATRMHVRTYARTHVRNCN